MVLSLIVALTVAIGLWSVARFRPTGKDITAASDRWTLPLFALAALGAGIWATLSGTYSPGSGTPQPYSASAPARALFLLLAAGGVVMFHHRRMVAVVLLAAVGLAVATFAAELGGADVALAVIGLTGVTAIMLAGSLPRIGYLTPRDGGATARFLRALIAAGGGIAAALVTGAMLLRGQITLRPMSDVGAHALSEALEIAGADNATALVRLDYRALDTLAVIGCLAAVACARPGPPPASRHGPAAAGPVLPIALLLGLWFLLRGAWAPGGGLVAGLVIATGFLASGTPIRAPLAGAVALLLAGFVGLLGLAFGPALFTPGRFPPVPELTTGPLFDAALALAVLGAVLLPFAHRREA